MLRSVDDLLGYTVRATDGDVGSVEDFFFDDRNWTVRYFVVDTGGWLPGRRVLLSTIPFGRPEWEKRVFPVLQTRWQIEHSPDIDTHKPVSRQMEEELHTYYGWSPYWRTGAGLAVGIGAPAVAEAVSEEEEPEGRETAGVGGPEAEAHLRSVREVTGYYVQATDGGVGQVADFIVDDETWVMRYLVVDTRELLPGKRVLLAPAWVERIDWAERRVYVEMRAEIIKNSPEFDPSQAVNRESEVRLYDYYGRPKYWMPM